MASTPTSTSSTSALLEVGRVLRPHGLRGEVMVELVTNRAERMESGAELATDRGPLVVERARLHQPSRWVVAFVGVMSREAADELRGTVLRAPPLDDPDALWVHDLIGSQVVDGAGGVLGTIVSVQANPASDLMVLDGGGLIPLRFVTDHDPGRVVVDIPEGLLE